MTIEVICENCTIEEDTDDNPVRMSMHGEPLYFNPQSKTQSQTYTCPDCKHQITVIVIP